MITSLWLMENKRNETRTRTRTRDAIRADREARDKPALVVWSSGKTAWRVPFRVHELCVRSNGLLSASVRKGARVAILCPDAFLLYSVAGLWLIGAIPVNLPRESLPNLQHMTSGFVHHCAGLSHLETGVAGKLLVGGDCFIGCCDEVQYEIRDTNSCCTLGRAIPLSHRRRRRNYYMARMMMVMMLR